MDLNSLEKAQRVIKTQEVSQILGTFLHNRFIRPFRLLAGNSTDGWSNKMTNSNPILSVKLYYCENLFFFKFLYK